MLMNMLTTVLAKIMLSIDVRNIYVWNKLEPNYYEAYWNILGICVKSPSLQIGQCYTWWHFIHGDSPPINLANMFEMAILTISPTSQTTDKQCDVLSAEWPANLSRISGGSRFYEDILTVRSTCVTCWWTSLMLVIWVFILSTIVTTTAAVWHFCNIVGECEIK